jgi:hypothetical protein
MRLELIPQAKAVVQQASTTIDKASNAVTVQESYWNEELRETKKATADLHDLLIHTDISLNGKTGTLAKVNNEIIPRINGTLDATSSSIYSISGNSTRVLSDADLSVAQLTKIEEKISAKMDNPAYGKMLSNADASMASIKEVAAQSVLISRNVERTTADVQTIADEWAAPIKGTWGHIKAFLFEIAGPAASVAAAFK